MTQLSERLANLSPEQREMLLARLGKTRTRPDRIVAEEHDPVRPLSSTQQRLWFLEQFAPSEPFNVMSGVARIPFTIEPDPFIECLQRVTARHDILRTAFVIDQGVPRARVEPSVTVPATVLIGLEAAELEARFEQDAHTPFDLAQAPLFRVAIVPAPDYTLVQLTMHHLISDGFSNGVLFNELASEWAAHQSRNAVARPAPPQFQFADVVSWQQRRLHDSDHGKASVNYWVRHLTGAPERLTLKTTWQRPAHMSYRGGRLPVAFPPELVERVRKAAAEQAVTPFSVVLAGYVAVLSRFADQQEIIVGIPVAGRDEPGTEALIGPFLNTLAMRFDVTDQPTFATLVGRVGSVVNDGMHHQDAPFEEVLRALAVARDPSRSPVFQTVFNFQFNQTGRVGEFELRDIHNGSAQSDLRLDLVSAGNQLTGHVDYASDVYSQAAVQSIIDALDAFLDAALTRPGTPIRSLPLMSPERAGHLVADGSTRMDDPPVDAGATAASMIIEQCRRTPQRTAITTETMHLTYAELDTASAALAARLREQVTAPHARIGLLLPRSPHTIVAMLALMRAGCSYVPLDPDYPRERLSFICQDADLAALITVDEHAATAGELVASGDVPVLVADAAQEPAHDGQPDTVGPEVDAVGDGASEAYTIYTSGSTGLPKGVQISHTSLVNFLTSMQHEPGIGTDDVLLAVTSPSFDIAALELLAPLTVGANVVVASGRDAGDGRRLAALLDAHHVTIMQATPATWQILLASGWPGNPRLLALCGGEALPSALAQGLTDRVFRLWNMYGPTETTIWSTIHPVTPDDAGATVPIGRPIRRTAAIVVDEKLHPVPAGVFGELCLGGDGLAIGYLDRPELTADRFAHPDWLEGRPLYRTGDLVVARADGVLEYVTRMDTQVKVRGYRIELGEIETVLDTHHAVDRSVVVVAGADQNTQLVAYVQGAVPEQERQVDLPGWLAERLPQYMVPTQVLWLDRLPLTPNGKIDRKALPEPHTASRESTGGGHTEPVVPPSTGTEQAVIGIWQELLDRHDFGVDDGFFTLGGHSLMATKLIFRIREVTGAELPLQVLFEGEPTVRRISALLDQGQDAAAAPADDLDLAEEAVLPDSIRPDPSAHVHSVSSPQHPLVTGGTGFMGSFLLAEILETTDAAPFCHVRAPSEAEGLARLRESMSQYGIWRDGYADRIIPVLGDLRRERIGLSTPMWDHLSESVDEIFHCGAEVNFLSPYATLKPANVDGTLAVLRLAVNRTTKPVHFVSTTYVFSRFSYPPDTVFTEDMAPIHDLNHTFGYTQSKWVSESMVAEAGRRGVPTYIYRAGRIAGHSRTGACQTYDFVWQAVRAAVEMGAAPYVNMQVDVTPVDYAVAALVRIARQPGQGGKAFHLVAPQPVEEPTLVEWMLERGYTAETLTFTEWCARMVERAAQLSDRTAGALAPFFSGILPLDQMPPAEFSTDNVQSALVGTGIRCPDITQDLINLYLDYFVDVGFLPPTTQQFSDPQPRETS
ncbi:non-ribosomal peptide synthetase [Pseudactinotalea sp. HY158]|uniref:non-ribosomal peptide synthetase n=1 Tax=Pseudactinotalea sp. HY158 TaxID=2654547 RepID=UPI00129C463B|nr:non-ribosomal peptide synthetase [Pseudactinotalea sp. HY158]QGH69474.1 amino acid adenylation domain-containing protein [Pseudactinotalea sp. HY158]